MSNRFAYVYVHLPFCDVICHYCDFYTVRAKYARHEEFFLALSAEADAQIPKLAPQLEAIYFGGGTPSVSPPQLIHQFLDKFRDRITPETEITLEANPTRINPETLRAWKAAGINRVSLGIQSLDDMMLKRIGRAHKGKQALDALKACREVFENVTGDLIYGVPGQPLDQPAEHALTMADAGLRHVSAYHLTLEPTHFLHAKLPDGDFAWEQVKRLAAALESRGFVHYETSNFGQPGYESRNNKNYWTGGSYLALGPSAHGFDGNASRWHNVADWEQYVSLALSGKSVVADTENLTPEQRRIEMIFTALRTSEGIDLGQFQDIFGQDLRANPFVWECEKRGLAKVTNSHFLLTFSGRMLGDEIARKLL